MCYGGPKQPRPLKIADTKPEAPGAFALLDLKRIGAGDLITSPTNGDTTARQNVMLNGSASNNNPYAPKVGFASRVGLRIP